MKKGLIIACFILLWAFGPIKVNAQYLPVVYNSKYSDMTSIVNTVSIPNSGDVFAVGAKGDKEVCMWLDREGTVIFSKEFSESFFSSINNIIPIDNKRVLLVGNSIPTKRSEHKASGKAIVLYSDGGIEQEFYIGDEKTSITDGVILSNNDYLFWGNQQIGEDSHAGYICRYDSKGQLIYKFTSDVGTICSWAKENEGVSHVTAVFNGGEKSGASVVKLDINGSPKFITTIPDKSFVIEECILSNEYTFISGKGDLYGGSILKLRPEGDIVYQKQIIENGVSTSLSKLLITEKGNLLIGGGDGTNAIFHVLRQDGTSLSKTILPGTLSAIASNPKSGDIAVTLYDEVNKRGTIVKLTNDGKKLYEKPLVSKYSQMKIDPNGDVVLGSIESGRISMLSSFGELLFDRYIDENNTVKYSDIYMANSGEVILTDGVSNITKLAHGIYIDDVVITKPIDGFATAVFTVTLSGYSFSDEGAPISVSVDYKTVGKTANSLNNFNDVSGTLSFIPSSIGGDKYMSRQIVEVPIKSNDYLEGEKQFEIELSGVQQSYIIKDNGVGVIEDQQCLVKMINTIDGIEGEKDIQYELGLFKSNGVKLVNKTNSDIVVDGEYGEGTADNLDYNYTNPPRLKIANDSHSGTVNIPTIEDTRYEVVKSLYVNFDKIHSMSDTKVSFPSAVLICEGKIYDQPAYVSIMPLGDQSMLNNTVSGFSKITLHRAKDGVVQTNNSGADIIIAVEIDSTSSAKKGVDFALVNSHNLKIIGNGKRTGVNLNGIVLFNPESIGDRELKINLKSINQIPLAGSIVICEDKKQSDLLIKHNK